MASSGESERVRLKLRVHLAAAVDADTREFMTEDKFGFARKQLAREWVQLTLLSGYQPPGDPRVPLRDGEDPEEKRADAAHTNIRHLQAGEKLPKWMLVGIEATINHRFGLPLPDAFSEIQFSLI